MLKAAGIYKTYGELEILKGVDLHVDKGEIVSIVGASGAGKSTLLHILGTLDRADRGEVRIADRIITGMNEKQLSQFRNEKIGFVFQFHHLLPEFTALENICIPAFIGGTPPEDVGKQAHILMERLGIQDRASHKPQALSGGEQQRVAIARALINRPAIVLADEPSGNLDSANAHALHQLLKDLQRDLNQTFIIVTHNEELARISDRTITMKDGLII